MKFDMHCHTKEGSLDAKVDIISYIRRLSELGFDGMLITDHNSYKGYHTWKRCADTISLSKPFTVLKGIEYDTMDAGHFLVILPDDIHLKLLEFRGITADKLIKIVHRLGGILGPAHPYGSGRFSIMNTRIGKHNRNLFQQVDFIETYNGCEKPISNIRARFLAYKYKKPSFGGSDAHRLSVIGCAYTDFKESITSNDDLIRVMKSGAFPTVPSLPGRSVLEQTIQEYFPSYGKKNRFKQSFFNFAYAIYHPLFSLLNFPFRMKELRKYRTYYKS